MGNAADRVSKPPVSPVPLVLPMWRALGLIRAVKTLEWRIYEHGHPLLLPKGSAKQVLMPSTRAQIERHNEVVCKRRRKSLNRDATPVRHRPTRNERKLPLLPQRQKSNWLHV